MSDQATTKMLTFAFRIRQRYFDAIVAGTKTVEYRKDTPFWQLRIKHACPMIGCAVFSPPDIFDTKQFGDWNLAKATFICGKQKHKRWIRRIKRISTPEYFSDQGKKDVNTPTCLAFHLGQVVSS